MGHFSVLNQEQAQLVKDTGMDPEQFVVIFENDRHLAMLHTKSRSEVTIHKNEVKSHGSQ